jgi:hypothetical protein
MRRAPVILLLLGLVLGLPGVEGVQPLTAWLACGPSLPAGERAPAIEALVGALREAGAATTVATVPAGGGLLDFGGLAPADVAIVWVHGRAAGAAGRRALTDFVAAGKGVVVLGAQGGAWTDWLAFEPQIEGARFGERFAGDRSMRTIQLLPHAIFTGIEHFDTDQPMRQCTLETGSWNLMEGSVGEGTVPMAWIRPSGPGRVVSFQVGDPAALRDPIFLRLVVNSARWAARRPIPGARVLVQRTYMNGAYPGALAVTFPGGPSLCYDIVRGGVNYICDGDFADLHAWFSGRHGAPLRSFGATLPGEVFYRENSLAPALKVGTDTGQNAVRYRGYKLAQDAVEFNYTIGGRGVRETLRATSDGAGLVRTFRVEAGPGPLWLRLPPGLNPGIAVAGARREGQYVRFDSPAAGNFAVTMRIHE